MLSLSYILSGSAHVLIENTIYSINYINKTSEDVKVFFESNNKSKAKVVIWTEDIDHLTIEQHMKKSEAFADKDFLENIDDEKTLLAEIKNHIYLKRKAAAEVYYATNLDFVKNTLKIEDDSIAFISKYSPIVICNMSQNDVIKATNNSAVQSVHLESTERLVFSSQATNDEYANFWQTISTYPSKDMIQARNDIGATSVLNAGYDGDGIILGVLEANGVPDTTHSVFSDVANRFEIIGSRTTSEHATLVSAIMVGNYGGIAPGVSKIYCAGINTNSNESYQSLVEQMLDNNVDIINMSLSINARDFLNEGFILNVYGQIAKWFDHIAYNHSVHLVAGSGNTTGTESTAQNTVSCNATAYNTITVGNVEDYLGNGSYRISAISSYSMSPSTAYKPDICAPGTKIYIRGLTTEAGATGTSCAAPMVSASIALLLQSKPTLLLKQAATKAVLLASTNTETIHNYDTVESGYRQYGAGIINIANAVSLASKNDFVNTSITYSKSEKSHYIGVGEAGRKVSVTLTFLKRIRFTSSDHTTDSFSESTLPNLNIAVYFAEDTTFSNPIVTSATTKNNVERITFIQMPNQEYVVRVTKVLPYEDNHEVLYSVAWYEYEN